jgi:hypothetical protein
MTEESNISSSITSPSMRSTIVANQLWSDAHESQVHARLDGIFRLTLYSL